MAPYRWLTPIPGGQPRNGFLVDEDGRILFWFDRCGPARVLAPVLAERIVRRFADTSPAVLIVFLAMAVGHLLGRAMYPLLHPWISDVWLALAGVGVIGAAALTLLRWGLRRHVAALVAGAPVVPGRQPPVETLKPSELQGRVKLILAGLVIVPVAAMFVGSAAGQDGLIGDRVVMGLIGLGLFALAPLAVVAERRGKRLDEIELAELHGPPPPPVPASARPRWHRFLAWMSSGWRWWGVMVPAALAGVWVVMDALTPEVTADQLAERYSTVAFGTSETDPLMKWQGHLLTVRLAGDHKGLPLADDLVGAGARLGIQVVPVDSPAEADIRFVQGPRTTREGRHDPAGGAFRHDTAGVLTQVQIEISLVSLYSLSETGFGSRDAHSKLDRRLLTLVTGWVFGFRGGIDFDERFKDAEGRRVALLDWLLAIHYDPRLRPGMRRAEAVPAARDIAREIVAAGGLDAWRASRPGR